MKNVQICRKKRVMTRQKSKALKDYKVASNGLLVKGKVAWLSNICYVSTERGDAIWFSKQNVPMY